MLLLIALTGALAVSLVTISPVTVRSPVADSSARSATGSSADIAVDFTPSIAPRAWRTIVLHHSATSGGDVASIDAVHRRQKDSAGKPWLGIGYHFVVGNGHPMADGQIEPTFRWLEQLPGAHAGKREQNDHGIGICLIGNFDQTAPTARQMVALGSLLATLSQRYSIPRERIVRHREVQATLCPGRLFPIDEVMAGLWPTNSF